MKRFHIQYNIGKARYVVSHHDGEKKNRDGSDFFDITIFSNKLNMAKFVSELKDKGYTEGLQ
jgi:hypothetical protein